MFICFILAQLYDWFDVTMTVAYIFHIWFRKHMMCAQHICIFAKALAELWNCIVLPSPECDTTNVTVAKYICMYIYISVLESSSRLWVLNFTAVCMGRVLDTGARWCLSCPPYASVCVLFSLACYHRHGICAIFRRGK